MDVADGNTISINDLFHRNIKKSDNISTFTVQGTDYELLNIEMEDAAIGGSKLYLCANSRVVREIPLEKQVVDLDKN
ncbi:MAG: ATP-binding protein, partial [Oscillospiraceae bacterium]|nr:ATP-binding protein [Oscillospiraceae bacterium]